MSISGLGILCVVEEAITELCAGQPRGSSCPSLDLVRPHSEFRSWVSHNSSLVWLHPALPGARVATR